MGAKGTKNEQTAPEGEGYTIKPADTLFHPMIVDSPAEFKFGGPIQFCHTSSGAWFLDLRKDNQYYSVSSTANYAKLFVGVCPSYISFDLRHMYDERALAFPQDAESNVKYIKEHWPDMITSLNTDNVYSTIEATLYPRDSPTQARELCAFLHGIYQFPPMLASQLESRIALWEFVATSSPPPVSQEPSLVQPSRQEAVLAQPSGSHTGAKLVAISVPVYDDTDYSAWMSRDHNPNDDSDDVPCPPLVDENMNPSDMT